MSSVRLVAFPTLLQRVAARACLSSPSADEQLNKIFAIIGSPLDGDIQELRRLATAPTTLGHARCLNPRLKCSSFHYGSYSTMIPADVLEKMRQSPYSKPALDFNTVFAHAHPDSVDLLSKMLRFSASSRISMFDARSHKFHDDSAASSAAAAAQGSSVCEEQVMPRCVRVDDCAACDQHEGGAGSVPCRSASAGQHV